MMWASVVVTAVAGSLSANVYVPAILRESVEAAEMRASKMDLFGQFGLVSCPSGRRRRTSDPLDIPVCVI